MRISLFFLTAALSVCFISVSICGQVAGGMNETSNLRLGGNNFIAGTVFFPSGRPVNTRMRIRLSTPTSGEFVATTDSFGQFIFAGLRSGSYSITIDREEEFEPASRFVEITRDRESVPQTYNVSIRLKDKEKSAKESSKPAVVSVDDAGVPKTALAYYEKGIGLSKAGDHRAAIEQLKLAIAAYPAFLSAFNELGVQHMRRNELDSADEALRAALKIKPDAFEPLLNRGITLFRLKRYEESEESLRSALSLKDQSYIAHYYLGRTLTSLEKYDAAEKSLNTAIELGGDEMKEGHRMLANLFISSGNDQRAIEELELYLKLVPNAQDAENLRRAIAQLKTPRPAVNPTKPN